MVHHALMVLAGVVRVSGATRGGGGVAVYIIQYRGRGAISPMSTRNVWSGGSESKLRTANLAAASARSLPRMFVCALILWSVVVRPASLLFSRSYVMLSRRVVWWW
jgi:hypothetical protein